MKRLLTTTAIVLSLLTGVASAQSLVALNVVRLQTHAQVCIDKVRTDTFTEARARLLDRATAHFQEVAKKLDDEAFSNGLMNNAKSIVGSELSAGKGPFCRAVTAVISEEEQLIIEARAKMAAKRAREKAWDIERAHRWLERLTQYRQADLEAKAAEEAAKAAAIKTAYDREHE